MACRYAWDTGEHTTHRHLSLGSGLFAGFEIVIGWTKVVFFRFEPFHIASHDSSTDTKQIGWRPLADRLKNHGYGLLAEESRLRIPD
mgnify:CR=1 FL=1